MNVEDESKRGLIGGFGDEPMALPAFEMSNGPVPGFMIKEEMGQRADDMEIKRLESIKLRISKINDIASVKGVLNFIIAIMNEEMEKSGDKPSTGEKTEIYGKGKKGISKRNKAGENIKKPTGKKPPSWTAPTKSATKKVGKKPPAKKNRKN